MALVAVGYLHNTDMKKFLKSLLWNGWSDFEIISQECSLGNPFQKNLANVLSAENQRERVVGTCM